MKEGIQRLLFWARELFFPVVCVGCGNEKHWCCEVCRSELGSTTIYRAQDRAHQARFSGYLEQLVALFNYRDPRVRKLIHAFKYQYAIETMHVWSFFIRQLPLDMFREFTVIPIPLHPRRQRERGYNQSALLGQAVADRYQAQQNNKLQRKRYTRQQITLPASQRLSNIKEAFWWNGNEPAPERALLVDDVYTTGATMNECARILKDHGAQTVYGFVVARD